ncbi:MAG: xanthine dehydrogenase accessory protein XdhC [Comamonadaceae bacterium]|nr:MAG: xanthine dehydrogenase accessory protein XdhC [Comamonadaceae bacterium]
MTHSAVVDFTSRLARQDGVVVWVHAAQGSVPREAGVWMGVLADAVAGTIGGGQLEFAAIAEARRRLGGGQGEALQRVALGPSLGQCCGGVVELRYEPVSSADVPALRSRLTGRATPLALFGGGHVGRALVRVLAELPFAITWIDSRDEIFPPDVPSGVACEHSDPVQRAVAGLAAGSQVLIMSFSHAEDLDVVAACLQRQRLQGDLGFIGLIGSKTKWATFRHRLEARGFTPAELAGVTCPIGLPGIAGKEPEVIAVSVAAQLLALRRERPG